MQKTKKATEIDSFVGKQIRLKRINAGLSQSEVANKLNVSSQQLQKYELGANRISAGKLYEISKILETCLDSFFKDPFEKDDQISIEDLGKEILVITRLLNQVGAKKRKALIKVFKELLKFAT